VRVGEGAGRTPGGPARFASTPAGQGRSHRRRPPTRPTNPLPSPARCRGQSPAVPPSRDESNWSNTGSTLVQHWLNNSQTQSTMPNSLPASQALLGPGQGPRPSRGVTVARRDRRAALSVTSKESHQHLTMLTTGSNQTSLYYLDATLPSHQNRSSSTNTKQNICISLYYKIQSKKIVNISNNRITVEKYQCTNYT
jgi:hypothetical protein